MCACICRSEHECICDRQHTPRCPAAVPATQASPVCPRNLLRPAPLGRSLAVRRVWPPPARLWSLLR
eukprot:8458011-Lingulodinium_polyedra.AAC.1